MVPSLKGAPVRALLCQALKPYSEAASHLAGRAAHGAQPEGHAGAWSCF